VVPDEKEKIQAAVKALLAEGAELVLTTGGTGLSPRDITPDSIEAIASRRIPGIGELLRQDGARNVGTAWLSRSVACLVDGALVITLPGSRKAVAEGMDTLMPLLPHALHTLREGDHA